MDGSKIRESLALMNERGNGEGAGYAAYGIYPEYKDAYALHVFFDNVRENKPALVKELEEWGRIVHDEPIPIYEAGIKKVHTPWRFFFKPDISHAQEPHTTADDIVMRSGHAGQYRTQRQPDLLVGKEHGCVQGFGMA